MQQGEAARNLTYRTARYLKINNDKQRLSDKEVERMIRDAEKYAEQDAAATERINAITAMENYLDAAEKPLTDGGSLQGKWSFRRTGFLKG